MKQKATGLTLAERRHLDRVASAKRAHIILIGSALGPEAPSSEDFESVFDPAALRTRARILALSEQLDTLLVRVYLNGVGYAQDPGTRILLGRLLTYDAQHWPTS